MKFSIKCNELLQALQLVTGVLERQQTMPILSNVLLKTCAQQLTLICTDSAIELATSAQLETSETDATLTVPGKKLLDICRLLPEEAIIEFNQQPNQQMLINAPGTRYRLPTLPADNFPYVTWQESEQILEFSVPQHKLAKLISSTCFAMAKQDVRNYLNGLTFAIANNSLCIIATDGHRLALHKTTVTNVPAHSFVMPYKSAIEFLRLLEDTSASIAINIGKNHFKAQAKNFTFISILKAEQPPNYLNAIPKDKNNTIIIDVDTFKPALQRVAILANEISRNVILQIGPQIIHMKTQAQNQDAEEKIAIDFQGKRVTINLNVDYLLDIFNHAPEKTLAMSFKNAMSSILFTSSNTTNNDYTYMLMPLH